MSFPNSANDFFNSDDLMRWLLLNPDIDVDGNIQDPSILGEETPQPHPTQTNSMTTNQPIQSAQIENLSLHGHQQQQHHGQLHYADQYGRQSYDPAGGFVPNTMHGMMMPPAAQPLHVQGSDWFIGTSDPSMNPHYYQSGGNFLPLPQQQMRGNGMAPGMAPPAHASMHSNSKTSGNQDSKRIKLEQGKTLHTTSIARTQSLPSDMNHEPQRLSKKHKKASTDSLKSLGSDRSEAKSATPRAPKKRQRDVLQDIESRIHDLTTENAELRAHHMTVTQRASEVQKQRAAMEKLMTTKLAELMSTGTSDQSELAKIVQQYTEVYADYGKCRQREVAFHLGQLEKLLLPTITTKMCLWTLQQDKSFYEKKKSPMFNMLSKDLEITPDQAEKIQERRGRIMKLLGQLKDSIDLIQEMKVTIEKKHSGYDDFCGKVQSAATPKQIVLFHLWLNANAEALAKHIPNFSRAIHHMPHTDFLEGVPGIYRQSPDGSSSTGNGAGSSSSGSSSSSSSSSRGGVGAPAAFQQPQPYYMPGGSVGSALYPGGNMLSQHQGGGMATGAATASGAGMSGAATGAAAARPSRYHSYASSGIPTNPAYNNWQFASLPLSTATTSSLGVSSSTFGSSTAKGAYSYSVPTISTSSTSASSSSFLGSPSASMQSTVTSRGMSAGNLRPATYLPNTNANVDVHIPGSVDGLSALPYGSKNRFSVTSGASNDTSFTGSNTVAGSMSTAAGAGPGGEEEGKGRQVTGLPHGYAKSSAGGAPVNFYLAAPIASMGNTVKTSSGGMVSAVTDSFMLPTANGVPAKGVPAGNVSASKSATPLQPAITSDLSAATAAGALHATGHLPAQMHKTSVKTRNNNNNNNNNKNNNNSSSSNNSPSSYLASIVGGVNAPLTQNGEKVGVFEQISTGQVALPAAAAAPTMLPQASVKSTESASLKSIKRESQSS